WGKENWIAEEKYDGWRFLMHVSGRLDRAYMTGRRVSRVTGELSEKGLCIPALWPKNHPSGYTVIDGEILVPGGLREIGGIMNTSPENAAKKIAEIGMPTYRVFDILWHDGTDLRHYWLKDRQAIL